MDWALIAILATAAILLTVYTIAAWQMEHDTKPRDPYRQ